MSTLNKSLRPAIPMRTEREAKNCFSKANQRVLTEEGTKDAGEAKEKK